MPGNKGNLLLLQLGQGFVTHNDWPWWNTRKHSKPAGAPSRNYERRYGTLTTPDSTSDDSFNCQPSG